MNEQYFLQLDNKLLIGGLNAVFVYKYMVMINAQVSNTGKCIKLSYICGKVCGAIFVYIRSLLQTICLCTFVIG